MWNLIKIKNACDSKSINEKGKGRPHWCGSEGRASFCKPEGHQFDSLLGHMLGWGPGPWLGQGVTNQYFSYTLMFLCLSLSLSPSLKLNK